MCSHSVNSDRTRKLQTCLEPSDSDLSNICILTFYLKQKNVESCKREKSPKPSFTTSIFVAGTERVNEVRKKFVLNLFFVDEETSKNNF